MAAGAPPFSRTLADFATSLTSGDRCAGRQDAAVDCTYDPSAPGMMLGQRLQAGTR